MDKETVEKIIAEYEADKQNKGFFTIIMNDGKRHGQTPTARNPLNRFELLDDKTLVFEFGGITQYILIANIMEINLRSKFI